MDVHSISLILAVIAAGGAVIAAVAPLIARHAWYTLKEGVRTFGIACGGLALVVGSFSFAFHFVEDHNERSLEPLALHEFVVAHPVYIGIGLVALASLAWLIRYDPRS